ncbi:uncharacterized protein BO88DRAFT_144448 [Aspergillus vadensis CBS 113365]|uniref:Uncharacterized protein n=1 Tax=Aspergillus vadensis (strain CBS 113365 / IMI 142717 / IBT 24658) TaxID=1448311 RepID=A0A319C8W1_ASPVC|nr:hypothetical protein BO88DRAFT_144448 [Aspergillus vadensis CBS 113365]PYH65172.1 hypothetical protein BO88DRAFT_144448 [Aspergillus vadensis CBS 113365]
MDPKPEHLVVGDGVSGRHGREASRGGNIERHRGRGIRVEGQQTRAGEADKSGRRNRGQRRQAHRGTAKTRMIEIAGGGENESPGSRHKRHSEDFKNRVMIPFLRREGEGEEEESES